MLINNINYKNPNVKFISYTGKYPSLCMGILTLEIDGKQYQFGNVWPQKEEIFPRFWLTGGDCGFKNNYTQSYVNEGEWQIDYTEIPEQLRKYAREIDEIFNLNVPYGCCGGCL